MSGGTGGFRFVAPVGFDTVLKNDVSADGAGPSSSIVVHHQCIAMMNEYEGFSLEELRVADYLGNRKRGQIVDGKRLTGVATGGTRGLFHNPGSPVGDGTVGMVKFDPGVVPAQQPGRVLLPAGQILPSLGIAQDDDEVKGEGTPIPFLPNVGQCTMQYPHPKHDIRKEYPVRTKLQSISAMPFYSSKCPEVVSTVSGLPSEWTYNGRLNERPNMSQELQPHFVDVPLDTQEYDMVANIVKRPMMRVERVQNVHLFERFKLNGHHVVSRLQKGASDVTRVLFHGTSVDASNEICREGFERGFAGNKNGAAYGNGVYFAKRVDYALAYALKAGDDGCILISDVIIGDVVQGSHAYVPPTRSVNAAVNSVHNPFIFVIFRDDFAYPRYRVFV